MIVIMIALDWRKTNHEMSGEDVAEGQDGAPAVPSFLVFLSRIYCNVYF